MKPEENNDDIDADLRALFADQRLSVPVGADVVSSVVAGANRRRRRRTVVLATSGALGVAAVLLAGGLFAGHVIRPDQVRTATPTGLATSSYPSPAPEQSVAGPAPQPTVIGPTGFGGLTIGMSVQQVLATGLVNTKIPNQGGCTAYTYQTRTRPSPATGVSVTSDGKLVFVYLSPRASAGVQEIIAPSNATTPEGIGVGSPVTAIRARYGNAATQKGSLVLVPVPGHTGLSYQFTVDDEDTVSTVGLGVTGETCQGG